MDFESYLRQPLPFENEIARYFKAQARLTIFDIGTCEGEDTIRLARRFPNALIFSFEPLPDNVSKTRRNLEEHGLPATNVYELALSNRDGTADFYVSSGHPEDKSNTENWNYGNKSSSLLEPAKHREVHTWVEFDLKIRVSTMRLDTFCERHNVDGIDLMYLDVQGAELMVLEGAGRKITDIGAIWMEVEAIELYKDQPTKPTVEAFMEQNNFVKVVDTVDDLSGDQLYVHRDLRQRRSEVARRFLSAVRRVGFDLRDRLRA